MTNKEKYFSKENLPEEVDNLIDEIRNTGVRDRKPDLSGSRPALLVTDMQEYFLNPASHAFIPSAEAIIPNINRLINHFQKNNFPVILTKHTNTEESAGKMKSWWHDLIKRDSPLFSLSPLLQIPQSSNPPIPQSSGPQVPLSPGPLVLEKSQYDAFYQTKLEQLIKDAGIDTLVICGVMTNLCCETTLRSAFVRGFNAIMPIDATASYRRDYHLSTFINLSFGFCPLVTTEDIINFTGK
jgi:isochorismate hydrolase